MNSLLTDGFGRRHDYLRISLTDKCNLRCTYCMPNEHYDWMPNKHLMQVEEIREIASTFVELGVKRIRLTGGEPLARKEFPEIVRMLAEFPVDLALTTNGIFIDRHLDVLKEVGLTRINLSLDTLRKDRFAKMTQRDQFDRVKQNMRLLLEEGFRMKLNVVAMKGENDDELIDFVKLAQEEPIHVRFIEFMPFDGNAWNLEKVLTYEEILRRVQQVFRTEKLNDDPHATTKSYRVEGAKGTFAIISTVSEPFCSSCNRMRLTADGKMRNCLFSQQEMDLLTALRSGQDIRPLIGQHVMGKHWKLGGLPEFENHDALMEKLSQRSMIKIGG